MIQAKQKAFELKERFDGYLDYAEKAVDEIINALKIADITSMDGSWGIYQWKEVKKELQNL